MHQRTAWGARIPLAMAANPTLKGRSSKIFSPGRVQVGHGGLSAEGIKSAEVLLRANLTGVDDCQDVITQLQVLKQTFELFDRDGDGMIDLDEFHKITSVMGLDMTRQQAQDLLLQADNDGNMAMGFEEFIVMMGKRQDQTSQDLEGAWQLLDPDGVGYFEADKLKDLVLKSGQQSEQDGRVK